MSSVSLEASKKQSEDHLVVNEALDGISDQLTFKVPLTHEIP